MQTMLKIGKIGNITKKIKFCVLTKSFLKRVKVNTTFLGVITNYFSFSFRIVDSQPHSRMWYRIGAVRNITGGRKTAPAAKLNEKLKEVKKQWNNERTKCNLDSWKLTIWDLFSTWKITFNRCIDSIYRIQYFIISCEKNLTAITCLMLFINCNSSFPKSLLTL